LALPLHRIGKITTAAGLQVLDGEAAVVLSQKGYAHFG